MAQEEKPRYNRFFRTRRRFLLCLCCLAMMILAAIMLPVIIFVVVPAVAQSAINASKMTITASYISAPHEDGFTMKMQGTVSETGPFDAQIEMARPVKVIANGIELGQVALSPISAKAGMGAQLDASAPFKVTNKTAFGEFAKIMLGKEKFTWTLDGEVNVHAMGITLSGIKMVKDIELKGMNNFPGVEIRSFDLPSNHPAGGIALKVVTALNNPSPIGMEVGDMHFDMVYRNLKVGEVVASAVTLVPGTNVLNLEGRLVPLNTTEDLAILSDMMTKYMSGQTADVGCVGTMTRPNNTTEPISWLQAGFKGTAMSVPFPGAKDLKIVNKVEIGSMFMEFTPETTWSPLTAAKDVKASFKMPFNFPLSIKSIAQNITVVGENGEVYGTMSTPMSAASGDTTTGVIVTSMENVRMHIDDGAHETFPKFVLDLSQTQSKPLGMQVEAMAVASTAVGDLTIAGMKFSDMIPLQGMNGLRGAPISVKSMIVRPGTKDALPIDVVISIQNPANVGLKAGPAKFNAYFQGHKIGIVQVPNMGMEPGTTTLTSTMLFSPQGEAAVAAGRQLLNAYMQGKSATVGIAGESGAEVTPILALQPALGAMRIESAMPGLVGVKIMRQARFGINLKSIFSQKAFSSFDAYNPLDAPIRFLSMDAKMIWKGNVMGEIKQTLAEPMLLHPKSVTSSKRIEADVKVSLEAIKLFVEALKGSLTVTLVASVTASIGDYVTSMDFTQDDVPMVLDL